MRYYLGIDPGGKGSATILDSKSRLALPPILFGKVDEYALSDWFRELVGFLNLSNGENTLQAVLEKVHAMPGQGVSSMFSFGLSTGFVRGLLVANQISFIELHPKTWQKKLEIPGRDTKNETKAQFKARLVKVAQRRWPKSAKVIGKDNADSILLAEALRLTEVSK